MFDLSKSPIRINLLGIEEGKMSIFEDDNLLELESQKDNLGKYRIKTILNDIENMLTLSEEAKDDTVKIAVMGEVKAGKSTFVNVCARKQVAYTDICEATALVSEITYSEEEFVHVLGVNGDILLDFSLEELIDWSEKQQEKQFDTEEDVFKQYDKIVIGVNVDFFKNLIFVDTPGLLSIKEKNHEITNRYVAETDYILWVLDSEDIGSKAVNDELSKISKSGKPLIGIINKVDNSKIEREIREYIEREYSDKFESIIYISALNEWKSIQKNDLYSSDRLLEFLHCIDDLKFDKDHSYKRTEDYQLHKELELHQRINATISARKEYYDRELDTLSSINEQIKESLKQEFERWIKEKLFVKERVDLLSAKEEDKDILYNKYKSEEYVNEVVKKKYEEMIKFARSRWDLLDSTLSAEASQVHIDFNYDKNMEYSTAEEANAKAKKQMMGILGSGLKSGAGIGVAMAGYAAWLGPAADVITFSGAIVPYTVPLAMVGVGIALNIAKKNIKLEKDTKKKQEQIDELYKAVQNCVWNTKDSILGSALDSSQSYYNAKCGSYKQKVNEMNFDYDEPRYSIFDNSLKEYIKSIEEYISNKNDDIDDIPEPPQII